MRSSSPRPFLRSFPYDSHPPHSTWFLRTTAIAASWLVLAGYTLLSLLVSPSAQLRWSTDVLAALGGIALTAGYLGGLIAYFFARAASFRLDNVLLPLLLSSVGGLFQIVLSWAVHREVQAGKAYVYAPLGVACVGTVLCAGGALFINTQLKIQEAVEESRKRHHEMPGRATGPQYSTTHRHIRGVSASTTWDAQSAGAIPSAGTPFLDHRSQPHSRHTSPQPRHASPALPQHPQPEPYDAHRMPMPPPLRHMSSTELRPIEMHIPEDEAQRRQLLRLLIAKEQADDPHTVSSNPGTGTSSTYRIDWPGGGDDSGMLSPQFPPPPSAQGNKRQSSEISNRWTIGNLLGRKTKTPEPVITQADVKEERDRRRREIERSSLSEGMLRSDQALLSERSAYGNGEA